MQDEVEEPTIYKY
jgi:hypothetical protein